MQEHAEGPRSKPPKICPHCGTTVAPEDKICPKCGAEQKDLPAGEPGRR